MGGEKKSVFNLPLKLILTEAGYTFFIRKNKKLLRFRLADNLDEYGISLEDFTPGTIQRLLLIDYVSKIEISRPEFPGRKLWIYPNLLFIQCFTGSMTSIFFPRFWLLMS